MKGRNGHQVSKWDIGAAEKKKTSSTAEVADFKNEKLTKRDKMGQEQMPTL